jgi:hypothetical protein
MATSKADSKKRVVLPAVQPGDVFDIQKKTEGQYVLIRLERPEFPDRVSRKDCLKAMDEAPLCPAMSWEELRKITREA